MPTGSQSAKHCRKKPRHTDLSLPCALPTVEAVELVPASGCHMHEHNARPQATDEKIKHNTLAALASAWMEHVLAAGCAVSLRQSGALINWHVPHSPTRMQLQDITHQAGIMNLRLYARLHAHGATQCGCHCRALSRTLHSLEWQASEHALFSRRHSSIRSPQSRAGRAPGFVRGPWADIHPAA